MDNYQLDICGKPAQLVAEILTDYCWWGSAFLEWIDQIILENDVQNQFWICGQESNSDIQNREKISEKHSNESVKDEDIQNLEVLKDCQYSLRYDQVGNTNRKRRVIIWGHTLCWKEFVKAWNFLDHYRMHIGIKPFDCEVWGKSFTQKGNLKKHQRQHNREDVRDRKVHACHLCNKSYTERYNLRVRLSALIRSFLNTHLIIIILLIHCDL